MPPQANNWWDQQVAGIGGQPQKAANAAEAHAMRNARQQQQAQNNGFAGLLAALATPRNPYDSYADAMRYQADAGLRGSLAQTGADYYRTDAGLQQTLNTLPWQWATQAQASVPAAQAQMYGAQQGALGNVYGGYYPASAAVQTAHFAPWADVNQANIGALAAQNIAQLNNEAKGANLASILQLLGPLLEQQFQPQLPPGVQTNYGAGFSY